MQIIKKYHTLLISFLGGVFYALGFPMKNGASFFLGSILGFILLNWAIDKKESLKMKFVTSLFYSFGFYLMGFYWIPETIKEFGGLVFPFNYILGLIFSVIVIPQVYVFVFVKKYFKHSLILAASYVLLETIIPQQFPAHLGHPFLSLTPFVKLVFAPIAGGAFYSFFVALTSLTLLDYFQTKKMSRLNFSFIILVIAIHLPFMGETKREITQSLNVRMIQPNIGNFLKISSEKGSANSIEAVLKDYHDLSTAPTQKEKLDLIVWPETAYPLSFYTDNLFQNDSADIHSLFKVIAKKTDAELFFGGYDSSLHSGTSSYTSDYNSAFHVGSDAKLKNVYHKMKLIPFGEGLPFGPLNQYLSTVITNISYFSEGDTYTSFNTKNNVPFAASICYEILFPDFIKNMLNHQKTEAQFMINLTNDSWYGDTAEPRQHLFLSKWRPLEFNLPIIRSTNTGITTIMYPDGSESNRLEVGEKNYIDLKMDLETRTKTIYQSYGYFTLIAIVFALLLIELIFKRKAFFKEIMQTNKA